MESTNLKPEVEPIAIVGIGCRFPGGVKDPETFWDLLKNGVHAITEVPPDRFDIDAFYHPEPQIPGKLVTRYGGFIDDVDKFDADFFEIAHVEAERMDPQQRLLLAVSWEALEDAGIPAALLSETSTGVFVGSWLQDFESRLVGNPSVDDLGNIDLYTTIGSGRYSLASRLSFFYGFHGPSLVVDTHCSSSLVAIHLGCQSIWQKECEIAIAGGTNVILTPYITVAYSQSGMMAPDGRCKFGDARANGYVRSEGCGLVVLKPYSKAVEDGNDIYAVIIGSAVNNDGRSSGFLTTPGQDGQQDVLRKAYCRAGISPGMVQYIEAHGTGTPTGDPVELKALGAVLGGERSEGKTFLVGSVKTNIGHTEGAAGVAGLIKLALSLKNREIPPSLHFHTPNPQIPWDTVPLRMSVDRTQWVSRGCPRIGGVSSFGITGTNAHVVMQDAPAINQGDDSDEHCKGLIGDKFLFPISAQSPEALKERVRRIELWLQQDENSRGTFYIDDLCATAALKLDHLGYRMALVAENLGKLKEGFSAFLEEKPFSGLVCNPEVNEHKPKVVFVFPGQGAQYPGMCRKLLANSGVFSDSLKKCERALKNCTDWSLVDQLLADPEQSRMDEIDVIQPTLFSIQIALAAQWCAWGVEPDAVVGHSMGEAAAAFVCGALTLEEAALVISKRSQLMKKTSGRGAMAVVELTVDQALAEIAGMEKELSIAVCNSPRSTVLSGDPSALDGVLMRLESRGVFCRKIKVDVASHSPQMDPLRLELAEILRELRPKSGTVPMYSTVTGALQDGKYFDADYWGENLRRPVHFAAAVSRLLESNHNLFIEMSPHPLLLRAIEESSLHHHPEPDSACFALPSLVRGEDDLVNLLASLGSVYASGYPVRWQSIYNRPKMSIKFPTYPWQGKRYWFDETGKDRSARRRSSMANQASEKKDTPIEGARQDSGKGSMGKAMMTLRESLNAAEAGQPKYLILERFLKEQLSQILSVPASQLDSIRAFKAYGMDSLRGIKFRSRIESATGLELSSTVVWNYPNIKKLTSFLIEKLEMTFKHSEIEVGIRHSEACVGLDSIGADVEDLGGLFEELESISDEEARKLLENG